MTRLVCGFFFTYIHNALLTHLTFVLQLYDDLSTWRSDLKKTAISIAPLSYPLLPPPSVPPQQRATWVESAAKDLLQGGLYLWFGIDENVSDLALIMPILMARSTGENEEFR